MKIKRNNDCLEVTFKAGRSYDEYCRPASYWTGFVQYKNNSLWAAQTIGTGSVSNTYTSSEENVSLEKANERVEYFRWLENHYKKIYEN